LRVAIVARLRPIARAHVHRQPDDRVVESLPVHFGQHGVGFGLCEVAAALDRRELRRIAQHQHRHAEGHQVAPEFGVHHGTFVDDDELGFRGWRLFPQHEIRNFFAALARAIDQAVNRGGAGAALAAHHHGGLAGEGRELHLALDSFGDGSRQRGLTGAGIAEQAENRRRAACARLCLQPTGDRAQGCVLMR
jgi:hypothetical protein